MATAKKATKRGAPAKKKASAAATGPADAITLLTADHAEVQQLFEQYEQLADADERQALAEQICTMLTVHTQIEEELFYPAAREAVEEDSLLDEAEVGHASAKDLIAQILEMDPDEALYDAKVTVLGEYLRHHLKEDRTLSELPLGRHRPEGSRSGACRTQAGTAGRDAGRRRLT